jgi:5'-methylthioadenosine phosphorylase
MKSDVRIGIIGGSGLYQMEGLSNVEEVELGTPFGPPSDLYRVGTLEGRRVAFLARHNRNHTILPSELNFRANIHGFKQLGAEWILSASAVGSLKEDLHPLDIILPDQFYDRTKARISTFFGNGIVAHVSFGDPLCHVLAGVIEASGQDAGVPVKRGGTYVCMEGPQFSTKAESMTYRSWGMDIIGMTNLTEAKLAREAEICYSTLAMVTDYDCWHPDHDSVTAEYVMGNLAKNAGTAKAVLRAAVRRLPEGTPRGCECAHALRSALVTPAHLVPDAVKKELAPIVGRYMK